jgi:transcriptional regulator with XRE-family HTH domain
MRCNPGHTGTVTSQQTGPDHGWLTRTEQQGMTYDAERELAFLEQQVLSDEEAALGDEVVSAWNEFQHAVEKAKSRRAREVADEDDADWRTQQRESMRGTFELHERVIGEKIRQLRVERGWSQEDLAAKLSELGFKMYQTTITKIEGGNRPLRVAELFAFCFAFHIPVPVMWYLRMRGEPPTIASMRERVQRADEMVTLSQEQMEHHYKQMIYYREERDEIVRALNDAAVERDTKSAEEG